MEKRELAKVLAVQLCVAALAGAVLATDGRQNAGSRERLEATVTPEPEPHKHLEGAWLDWFHDPAPRVKMGLDHRFRTICSSNITTLDDDAKNNKYIFQRYRTRWWTNWLLDEDTTFNTRLTWEFRTWQEPGSKPQHTDFDEALFDRMNVAIENMFDLPVSGVIGRQDIPDISSWLIVDGTPLDGSRTIFFDALRLTYDCKDKDTKIDFVYVYQKAASNAWLTPINDRNRYVTEQDEQGVILYLKNRSIKDTQLEGYFIYKNDHAVNGPKSNLSSLQLPTWSKDGEIFTFGAAMAAGIDENWSYRVEGALQRGDKDDSSGKEQDLQAYGSKNVLTYKFNDEKSNSLHTGYEYLSGDDEGSSRIEQFDPLWGEWPQWSELYIYTYSPETMIAETTNLHRWWFGHSIQATRKLSVHTDYHLLWADGDPINGRGGFFSNSGMFRGQLLTCWLKWTCCPQLSAHLVGEYLIPGSYYDHDNRDQAFFLRLNVQYVF